MAELSENGKEATEPVSSATPAPSVSAGVEALLRNIEDRRTDRNVNADLEERREARPDLVRIESEEGGKRCVDALVVSGVATVACTAILESADNHEENRRSAHLFLVPLALTAQAIGLSGQPTDQPSVLSTLRQ